MRRVTTTDGSTTSSSRYGFDIITIVDIKIRALIIASHEISLITSENMIDGDGTTKKGSVATVLRKNVNLFWRRYTFYSGICERLEFISFFPSWELRRVFFVSDESEMGRNLFDFAGALNRSALC